MFSVKKSDIFILLHLSTTSGPQESNSMFFQRKGIPDLWIAVQNIWNFRKISQMLCTVIHRHNDERKTAARWQKLSKSATMNSLRKGVPAMPDIIVPEFSKGLYSAIESTVQTANCLIGKSKKERLY